MHYLFLLPGLIIGLTVHEAAHAISARWLGDQVAWRQGRISLNPLRHLSLFGTLALFVLGFGWGKPVPVNLYNFRHPKRDYLICSLAGPLSNCLLSALALGLMTLSPPEWLLWILISVFMINAVLAVVNLIPIPPLDGSKIWPCLIPGLRPVIGADMTKVWMVVLLVGLYSGATHRIIRPTLDFLSGAMLTVLDDTRTYEERPEGFPEGLPAPADACEATYYVYPPHGDGLSSYALDYCIDRPYPCDALIAGIAADLEDRGWSWSYTFFLFGAGM